MKRIRVTGQGNSTAPVAEVDPADIGASGPATLVWEIKAARTR
jgi:hypothetical protein